MSKSGEFHEHMKVKGLLDKTDTHEYDLEASDYVLKLWTDSFMRCGCEKCQKMLRNAQIEYNRVRS